MLAKTPELQWRGKFPRLVQGDQSTAFQSAENCLADLVITVNTFLHTKPRGWVSSKRRNVRHEIRVNRPGRATVYLLGAFVSPKIINLLSCFVTLHRCVRITQASCRIQVPNFYSWFKRGLLSYFVTATLLFLKVLGLSAQRDVIPTLWNKFLCSSGISKRSDYLQMWN